MKDQPKAEINSLIGAMPFEIRVVIGAILIFFLFIGGMRLIRNSDNFMMQKCWEAYFHAERIFKFNACTGELVEIDHNTMAKKK